MNRLEKKLYGNNKQNDNNVSIIDEYSYEDSSLPMAPITPLKDTTVLTQNDLIDDIDFTRRTLQSLMTKSQQLVELALANAGDASQPRDIEVAANAINTAADTAERIINLHEKLQKIQGAGSKDMGTGNTFVQNSKTILCTTNDLLKALTEDKDL